MKKCCLCIIISIIASAAIGACCFFIGRTYSKCNDCRNDSANNKTENTTTPTVVDGISFVYEYDNETKITVPTILGTTDTIKSINNKIHKEVLSRIISDLGYVYFDMDHEPSYCTPFKHEYKTLTKNDIIVIYAYSYDSNGKACGFPASGGGMYSYNYFYDIKNDKELNISEAAKALGITNLDNATSYDNLKDNACAIIKVENGNLEVEAPLPDDCI